MRHNCKFKDPNDGTIYQPFQEAFCDGYIEYDDYFDGYLVSYESIDRIKTRQILGIWLPGKYRHRLDVLEYCPFCGEHISYDDDSLYHPKNRIKEDI